MTQSDKRNRGNARNLWSKIPFVNFTEISEVLDDFYGDRERPIEIFPRWIAQTNVLNGSKKTSSYMVAGDSALERSI